MGDYYSVLLRAVTARDARGAQWRRGVFARARQTLASQMRARRPPPTGSEIAAELAALDAAVERIESELSWTEHGMSDAVASKPAAAAKSRPLGMAWIVAAAIAAALSAGGYIFWTSTAQKTAPPPVKSAAAPTATASQATRAAATAKDGDLAPGIDGGSSDADLPYVFRRQPTFYRTLEPVGTIIVDKLQHLLYLIEPNNVALRYGIGLGEHCADLAGLHHIASKAEWPPWQPPPDMLKLNAKPVPGGPGNPLGARVLDLDDNRSRIHGTNAPKTIGSNVAFGCIRLVNDDIVDLYSRVQVGTPVLVN